MSKNIKLPTDVQEEKTIWFKSTPFNFEKEKSGVKNNTIRDLEICDSRWNLLQDMIATFRQRDCFIEIENSQTGEVFKRKIKDITEWKCQYIITWEDTEAWRRAKEEVLNNLQESIDRRWWSKPYDSKEPYPHQEALDLIDKLIEEALLGAIKNNERKKN